MSDVRAMDDIDDRLATVTCRFGCKAPVVGVYWMPRGCVCHPDQVQALCGQHALKAQALDGMTLIFGPGPYAVHGPQ